MHLYSATELHTHFMRGTLSAECIMQHFLQRIHRFDGTLGAFLAVYERQALAKARELDQKKAHGDPLGSLAAVPILLKDNMHVKGELTTCASKFLSNYIAPFDSRVAELIRAADGIIIGKSNMDEFAMGSSTETSAFHITRNPWDLQCSPGGSSGGAAAAVAARLVPLALGSDTGGSIRQPAAFCGVVGFKPSYGAVSRYGLVPLAHSFDQIGPLAANVADAALLMDALDGRLAGNSAEGPRRGGFSTKFTPSLKGLKIGVPYLFLEGLELEPRGLFEKSLDCLRELGAEIVAIELPILKHAVVVYSILSSAEALGNLTRFDGIKYGAGVKAGDPLEELCLNARTKGFGFEVKRRLLFGALMLSEDYREAYHTKAMKIRACIIHSYQQVFASCAVIATPTTPRDAFQLGQIRDGLDMHYEDLYTVGANLAGLPAITVPCGMTAAKKPFGLHLLATRHADATLLQVAHCFETGMGTSSVLPDLPSNEN